ncbi:MAG: HAD hydrolase-like protein [Candidatus Sericytochromatia bacterium]|nr:HAD hydrolase-like protein [Candidatus Sericytochromatia bacterium]
MVHVAFDFDGTLVDSRQMIFDLYNDLAAQRGYTPITMADLADIQQLSIADRWRALKVPIHHLPGLVIEVGRRYKAAIGQLAFYPGVPEMLGELQRRGVTAHILSSNTVANIRAFLDLHGVTAIESVHSARTLLGKNRAIATFMRNRKLTPKDLIYVGDEERDIVACRANDVRVIAVSWGFEALNVLERAQPDFLAHRTDELLPLIVGCAPAVTAKDS